MARPVLSICVRCRHRRRDDDDVRSRGDELAEEVRALRKRRELRDVFKIDEVDCLSLCDAPCAVQLEGKKRSSIARVGVVPADAARLVEAMVLYAALEPGQELPERVLPGEHAD